MDKRLEELVAFKRNKVITPLQTEELDIRLKLGENITKQGQEQVQIQKEDLRKAGITGDQLSQVKFEDIVVGEKEEEVRQSVRKDLDSKARVEDERLVQEQKADADKVEADRVEVAKAEAKQV